MKSLPSDLIEHVCRHFSIGEVIGEPKQVSGGLLHLMWSIPTKTGRYALKVLNPEVMMRPGVRPIFQKSELMARSAANAGIPAVAAWTVDGDPLFEIGGTTVMLYTWVDGLILSHDEIRPEHARTIGKSLYEIHCLSFQESEDPAESQFPALYLDKLIERGRAEGQLWAEKLESGATDLLQWNDRCKEAMIELSKHQVLGHRDLNTRNVLWKDGDQPYIIDWEAAGPINPAMELIDAAINWSGEGTKAADQELFLSVIRSYKDAGGILQSNITDACFGRMWGMLEWLAYNMRRTLDTNIFEEAEQAIGAQQVEITYSALLDMSANMEKWVDWAQRVME